MKYTRVVLLSLVSLLTFLSPFVTGKAFAACQPVFGGGTSCTSLGNLQIDKTIVDPQTGSLTDTPNSFAPNQQMTFHLDVKNTGRGDLKNVTVSDTFPQVLTFLSGPGSYNMGNRTLTIMIDTLKGKETKTFTILSKTNDISSQKACSFNHAEAVSGRNHASDNIQFCVETNTGVVVTSGTPGQPGQVTYPSSIPGQNMQQGQTKGGQTTTQPVFPQPTNSKTPATGPEMWSLVALLPAALTGWTLRKKTKAS